MGPDRVDIVNEPELSSRAMRDLPDPPARPWKRATGSGGTFSYNPDGHVLTQEQYYIHRETAWGSVQLRPVLLDALARLIDG